MDRVSRARHFMHVHGMALLLSKSHGNIRVWRRRTPQAYFRGTGRFRTHCLAASTAPACLMLKMMHCEIFLHWASNVVAAPLAKTHAAAGINLLWQAWRAAWRGGAALARAGDCGTARTGITPPLRRTAQEDFRRRRSGSWRKNSASKKKREKWFHKHRIVKATTVKTVAA